MVNNRRASSDLDAPTLQSQYSTEIYQKALAQAASDVNELLPVRFPS